MRWRLRVLREGGGSGEAMRSQKVPYWADKEAGGESEDESRSGSESGSEDNEEGDARGGTSGSVPLWPQSYR